MTTQNWFTTEKIDDETYAISEYRHWEQTHVYLLLGTDKAFLIDSGLGVANIRLVVEAITSLPVTVLTTHAHWDHIGGHGLFDTVGVHRAEKSWLTERFPLSPEAVRANLTRPPHDFPADFDPERYTVYRGETNLVYDGGEQLDLGGRTLEILHTPGHSPGHCCFYEAARGYLFSGDLIYKGTLDAFYPTTDPVLFARSVAKIKNHAISRVLPGHFSPDIGPDMINRIDAAFSQIARKNALCFGSGVFDFGDFSIHL